jgi:hypothetical protein
MKFSIQHRLAVTGNVVVGAEAENAELIARVACTLEAFELGIDELEPLPFPTKEAFQVWQGRARNIH